jgi:hypothetical protein
MHAAVSSPVTIRPPVTAASPFCIRNRSMIPTHILVTFTPALIRVISLNDVLCGGVHEQASFMKGCTDHSGDNNCTKRHNRHCKEDDCEVSKSASPQYPRSDIWDPQLQMY